MCLSNSLSRLERISTFEKQVSKQCVTLQYLLSFFLFFFVDYCHFQSFFLTKSGSFGSQRKICQLELYLCTMQYCIVQHLQQRESVQKKVHSHHLVILGQLSSDICFLMLGKLKSNIENVTKCDQMQLDVTRCNSMRLNAT